MRRIFVICFALLAATLAGSSVALADGGMGGMGGQSAGMGQPSDHIAGAPADKSDAAATKAYAAGMKSLAKAKDQETAAAKAPNEEKKIVALSKMNDAYNMALDQFTEALSNRGDMYEAWNNVGYVHLRLGAYAESVDDYNHTLKLKPDLLEAIEHRGEAYVAIDGLDEAKSAYMDLFNHDRTLAARLMLTMQQWLTAHRANPNGMQAADIDAFDKWLKEHEGVAKQTASLPPDGDLKEDRRCCSRPAWGGSAQARRS